MALHNAGHDRCAPAMCSGKSRPFGRGLDGCRLQPQPPIVPSDLHEPARRGGPVHQLRRFERGGPPTSRPTGGSVISVPSLVDTPARTTPSRRRSPPAASGKGSRASSTVEKAPKVAPGRRTWLRTKPVACAGVGPGRYQDTPASAQTREPQRRLWPGPARPGHLADTRGMGYRFAGRGANQPTSRPRVRRASLSGRLKPFLDESNANELMYPNKADRPWRYIVLHHSASASGNYDQIDGEHRKILGIDGCGYHFVIGNGIGQPRRPDRSIPALEEPEAGSPHPQRPDPRRRRIRDRHLPCRRFRPAASVGTPACRDAGPDCLSQQAVQHRSRRRADPRPPGRHQDGLPRQVFPE